MTHTLQTPHPLPRRAIPSRAVLIALTLALVQLGAACGDDFAPYNQLSDDLRVLGLRADTPWLMPGEAATLDALVHAPSDGAVTYAWSWCPLLVARDGALVCAVEPETFEALSGQATEYALGQGATALLPDPVAANARRDVCRALAALGEANVLGDLTCAETLPVAVILHVQHGASEVVSYRRLDLPLEGVAGANTNPDAMALRAQVGADEVALSCASPAAVEPGARAALRVELADGSRDHDPALDAPEGLVVTWFVEGGETDAMRTGAFDSASETLEAALENGWELPGSGDVARAYAVVRDTRGGIDWVSGCVALSP